MIIIGTRGDPAGANGAGNSDVQGGFTKYAIAHPGHLDLKLMYYMRLFKF